MLTSWDGTARNLRERVALAVTARSPIERLLDFKKERGWQNLQIYSDVKGDYTRSYVSADDGDAPGLSVFARRDGTVRHFWSGEMSGEMAAPVRTRAEPRTSTFYGQSSISRPRAVALVGIQSSNTTA